MSYSKAKISRFFGGILLVAGTTIGAGMLGLPAITVFAGFFPSALLFLAIWVLMFASAWFFLDVNLAVRGEPNLISMARRTLGKWGQALGWTFYLLLLYCLVAAYIAGSAPLFESAANFVTGKTISNTFASFCLPVLLGVFIYMGTKSVDYVNRILMAGLAISYFFLILFLPSHVQGDFLLHSDFPAASIAISVIVTSFGFHIIIPSLTTYMGHDKKLLRWTIFIGSFIPFLFYLVWQFLVIGAVPLRELANSYVQGEPATAALSRVIPAGWLKINAQFFAFFAIITSFIGVALSLSDFLVDGFKIKKNWKGRFLACLLTFVPPLFFALTYQRGFYMALKYAGAFVALLLIFLPAAMAWKLKDNRFYTSLKGRALLCLVILLALVIVVIDFLEQRGAFSSIINKYVSSTHSF